MTPVAGPWAAAESLFPPVQAQEPPEPLPQPVEPAPRPLLREAPAVGRPHGAGAARGPDARGRAGGHDGQTEVLEIAQAQRLLVLVPALESC